MRIAILGDIHGNLFALQAVLSELRQHSPDAMVISGDLVYKFPWGAEVIDLLNTLPLQAVHGNSELYLLLWGSSLWPERQWNLPLARETVAWERERLGAKRLAWLAALPEYVSLSASRLEDVLIVHGVPGNPFLPFLERPGEGVSPWLQTDTRVRELLSGVEADLVVCAHTHIPMQRRVEPAPAADCCPNGTLIVNPGAVGYARGPQAMAGQARYGLLDWSATTGWKAGFHVARYDPDPLYAALRDMRGDYPLAEWMVDRIQSGTTPRPAVRKRRRVDFFQFRWGEAPPWWDDRDNLAEWQALRGESGMY